MWAPITTASADGVSPATSLATTLRPESCLGAIPILAVRRFLSSNPSMFSPVL